MKDLWRRFQDDPIDAWFTFLIMVGWTAVAITVCMLPFVVYRWLLS